MGVGWGVEAGWVGWGGAGEGVRGEREKMGGGGGDWRCRVQELCESRGGHPGLSVLTSLLVSVDVNTPTPTTPHLPFPLLYS